MKIKLSALAAALVLLLVVPALAQAKWGAIAIDPETGKVGYARNDPTASVAKTHAKNRCGSNHCKVALWVFNGYGAVVLKKNGVYISGIGRTKAEAFEKARKRAREDSARSFAWVFSGYS
ncbi:MAG TPA: DUF4189 domain-containing protein [Solirubrobacterales bacterium]|nr:DUF4189 domain-containing protein [Solirubrobacterales bacterium]